MRRYTVPKFLLSGLAAAALCATPALAANSTDQSVTTGTPLTFQAPANPNGFYQTWVLNYPGDNSNITFDAELGGFDSTMQGSVGFNVFDSQHQTAPVEIATTQSNQKTNDPNGIEFNYSSGFQGPVNIQFFSLAKSALTVTFSQTGLTPTGGGTPVPVTLTVQGAPAATNATTGTAPASSPAPSASAAPSGATTPAGQPVTFSAANKPGGFLKAMTFDYPGDFSNITFDAELDGFDPSYQGAVGFNVFDSQHSTAPVEIATTQSNQKPNDPHGIEFVYSSGIAGPVTVQFFSYAPLNLNITLTNTGLVNTAGNATQVPLRAA